MWCFFFACICRILTPLPQHSDYDHGVGLSTNQAVKALIPVLSALASHLGKIQLVEEIKGLACVTPATLDGVLDRAIVMITAEDSTKLDRALAMAACVHLIAANSVRYAAGFRLWWVFFFFG